MEEKKIKNETELPIEWLMIQAKKMVSLIERYQEATTEEKKNFLRKKIEKEISLQKALLGKQEDLKKELGIIDADGDQRIKNLVDLQELKEQAPIIEC